MILAVTGSAGGVGRSTLAFELAAALDAVAVDADLRMADLPHGRGPDLHDVLAGRAAPTEAVRSGPVGVLPCGRSLAGARAADNSRLGPAIRRATRGMDAVIDCPAGRPDAALAVADVSLVVTTPVRWEPARDHRALTTQHDTGLVAGVWNRANEQPPPVVERTLAAPVVRVPADDALAESLQTGRPAVRAAPESAGADAVRTLAARVERCRPAHSASRNNR